MEVKLLIIVVLIGAASAASDECGATECVKELQALLKDAESGITDGATHKATCRPLQVKFATCVLRGNWKACAPVDGMPMKDFLIKLLQKIGGICDLGYECRWLAKDCEAAASGIFSKVKLETPILPEATQCPEISKLAKCYDTMPKECVLVKETQKNMKLIHRMNGQCDDRTSCPDMVKCLTEFQDGGPKYGTLDDNTCRLYTNFTRCVKEASCSGSKNSPGHLATEAATELMESSCNAIETAAALYDCPGFLQCVMTAIASVDPFSRQTSNLCNTAQSIVRCASNTIKDCPKASKTVMDKFIKAANDMALKAAGKGCGVAGVNTDSCDAVKKCKGDHEARTKGASVETSCEPQVEYERCMIKAMNSCGLEKAVTDKQKNTMPLADKALDVHNKICNATKGEKERKMWTCQQFRTCRADNKPPVVSGVHAENLCEATLRILGCARLYDEVCPVSPRLLRKLNAMGKEMLSDAHCPDLYGASKASSDPMPDKVPDGGDGGKKEGDKKDKSQPGSGASVLTGVPLPLLLVPTIIAGRAIRFV